MNKSSKLFHRLTLAADLPDEPIPGCPLVEIIGQERVLIENHLGVKEYGDDFVRVGVKFGFVCVVGRHLELARMTKEQLIISGYIESVQLNKGG
ncbi:MAG: hypothetical protein E7462_06410 [Ruminococcaceae bacterium]|nr:hypothetical protein [Oscillospiraceae bacterium]